MQRWVLILAACSYDIQFRNTEEHEMLISSHVYPSWTNEGPQETPVFHFHLPKMSATEIIVIQYTSTRDGWTGLSPLDHMVQMSFTELSPFTRYFDNRVSLCTHTAYNSLLVCLIHVCTYTAQYCNVGPQLPSEMILVTPTKLYKDSV